MIRRCTTILIIVISTMFLFSGCYVAYKDYYHEEDYKEIWELTGFWHGYEGVSPFFPESIDDLEVNKFLCRYDQIIPIGEAVQLFMEIPYTDEEVFNKEVEKIKSMAFQCDEYFEEIDFSVYAVRLGEEFNTEYALIDEEQQVVYYIFLHNVPKSEIRFEHRFIPKGYENYWNNCME